MFICCSTVFFPTLQRSSRSVSYVLFCPFQNLQSFYIFFQSVAWEIIIMCQKCHTFRIIIIMILLIHSDGFSMYINSQN